VSWQLQEAKQKFSELVRRTLEEGPQVVTKHVKEFLMSAPEGLEHIIPERPKDDYPRDVDLTDGS
jgi:hypothetical protein